MQGGRFELLHLPVGMVMSCHLLLTALKSGRPTVFDADALSVFAGDPAKLLVQ
jgi:NAD(P)H-hydrate repair Nnr-like enzyme with NAD(P)H-hydrate dehydratase domain